MKKLPISLLIQVLQLHLSHQETPVRKNALQQAMVVLERRWVELTHLKDIIFLMYQEGGQPSIQVGCNPLVIIIFSFILPLNNGVSFCIVLQFFLVNK